jgi:hypothetical protein
MMAMDSPKKVPNGGFLPAIVGQAGLRLAKRATLW